MDRLLHLRWERCRETYVSATAATPPQGSGWQAFRTRVRNQRRTTSAVTGFCDGSAMGHLLGYARVSTTDQQPHLQVDALAATGCSLRPPAASAAIAPPSINSWTSFVPATP